MALTITLIIIQVLGTLYVIFRGATLNSWYYKIYDKKYSEFIKEQTKIYETFLNEVTSRINLLSNENARLMEENEKLRDKLKNLGFSDKSLDN